MIQEIESLINGLSQVAEKLLAAGSLWIFPLVFVVGILSSLLPCVYPVIPITVGYLGATTSRSRARAFLLSLSYVAGICVVFTVIGAVFFEANRLLSSPILFGEWTDHPAYQIALGILFLLLGLWMLDVFHLTIGPSPGGTKKPAGPLGAFFVGMSAGLLIGPCTGPVLFLIMGVALREAARARAILLMTTYGFGVGMLFLVIGTFSALLTHRPRPGRWMNVLQKVFAAIILIVACRAFVDAGRLLARMSGPAITPLTEPRVFPAEEPPDVGTPLPDFSLPLVVKQGDVWSSDAFRSRTKPVLLAFWTTYCAACEEEFPILSALNRKRGARIDVIGVNVKERLAHADLDKRGIDYPVAFDVEGKITEALGVESFPWIVITDDRGVIRHYGAALPEDLEGFVEELLGDPD